MGALGFISPEMQSLTESSINKCIGFDTDTLHDLPSVRTTTVGQILIVYRREYVEPKAWEIMSSAGSYTSKLRTIFSTLRLLSTSTPCGQIMTTVHAKTHKCPERPNAAA